MGLSSHRLELTWYNKDQALIPQERGRYGYEWVDPGDPRFCETHTLVFDNYVEGTQAPKQNGASYSARADLEPQTDNLLITGESGNVLEALTRVPELAEKYVGNVKLIYIDPPFNTEQAFTSYEDNLEHSVWLTMMRDRLINLRRLLSRDGSIWIHLDEYESHRMRMLLDEVFGAGNFIADVAWQKTYAPDNRAMFTQMHDSIVAYALNRASFKLVRNLLPRSSDQDALYQNPDSDPRGPWKPGDFTAQLNEAENPRLDQRYTLVTPSGSSYDPPPGRCWVYTEPRYRELVADNRVYFGPKGTGRPALKRFLSEVMQGRVPTSWWPYEEVGHNQDAKKEIKALFPKKTPFDTPKPERLLERIIQIGSNPGDIVLDVFAGSGTTAAVAQKMARRWVTCELLEASVEQYTLPRLEKVIRGDDPGGITSTKGGRVEADGTELPEGVAPEEAQKLTSLLNKAIKNELDLKKDSGIRKLKELVKTKKAPDVVNWRGGGGFRVAHLSPSCYDYDPDLGLVTLTKAAEDYNTLVSSVAAQLQFWPTPNHEHFQAVSGRRRLAVTRVPLTAELAVELACQLQEGETLTVAATTVLDGARAALRNASRGSRVVNVPHDLFTMEARR
ncbi:MAG: site-specific DNA-methyltransferase [Leucobacter sp.]